MPKRARANKRRAVKDKKKGLKSIINEQSNLIILLAVLVVLTSTLFLSDSSITGFASTVNGTTKVNISTEVSITIPAALIDFGTCVPSSPGLNVSSSNLTTPDACSEGTYPSYMTIRNIGNVDIQIDVDANYTSNISAYTSPLIYGPGSTAGEFTFTGGNTSTSKGCYGTLANLTHFDASGSDQTLCSNLSSTNSQ